MTAEEQRLQASVEREVHWKRWGPYLSARQWGTVREDYSPGGDAWNYFPHDHARSRVYRWGEDGIGGICDRRQHICFAIALWNEKDPILKERFFGLTNSEGNHGEDVKEYYYYLDATPTSSYLKFLYKYPHAAYPYDLLVRENQRRTRLDPEYELIDTEIFRENRYFDVFVEYAKATAEDILIRITAWNRGPEPARLHLLPTIWFRNRWSWGDYDDRPDVHRIDAPAGTALVELSEFHYGKRWLLMEGAPELLFTENETNMELLYQQPSRTPYVKDAFHRYVVNGEQTAVNPAMMGTKAAAHYSAEIAPGKSWASHLRLLDRNPASDPPPAQEFFGPAFDAIFDERLREADEFYERRIHVGMTDDPRLVQRQAFAGLLWGKQSYHYDVSRLAQGRSHAAHAGSRALPGTQPRVDVPLQFGRHFHAGQVGVSVVRRVGSRVSLRGDGARRSGFRQGTARPLPARMVHASQRTIARVRMEFFRRESARARLGRMARV